MNSGRLLLAAIAWWRAKRPAQWTEEQHFAQPCVNLRGMEEFNLATSISDYLQKVKK